MSSLTTKYNYAKNYVICNGFHNEIIWQENQSFKNVTEQEFLREYSWVVLNSGMKETIINKIFSDFSCCFFNWESSRKICDMEQYCIETAKKLFNNKRKLEAITKTARIISEKSFGLFKQEVEIAPLEELKKLPFIGDVTVYHLAKNIGLPVAKPDRHLVRIANVLENGDVNNLCRTISQTTGDKIQVVDLVLWRFATIYNNYLDFFSNKPQNYFLN